MAGESREPDSTAVSLHPVQVFPGLWAMLLDLLNFLEMPENRVDSLLRVAFECVRLFIYPWGVHGVKEGDGEGD